MPKSMAGVTLRRAAWPCVALAAALTLCALVLYARNAVRLGAAEPLFLADVWAGLVLPPVGAYLVRRADNLTLGAILLSTTSLSVTNAAGQYATYLATTGSAGGALGQVAAWLATWTWVPYLLLPTLVPLLFPDGRPLSRPWRPVPVVVVGLAALAALGSALAPGRLDGFPHVINPWGIDGAAWPAAVTGGASTVLMLGFAPLAVLGATIRWRRAAGTERLRLGWFVAAAAGMVATLVLGDGLPYPWQDVLAAGGLTLLLVAVAISSQAAAVAGDLAREREQLVLTREEERLRLHRDLHDGLGPELAGIALQLGAARMTAVEPQVRQQLDVARDRLHGVTRAVRSIVADLRPPALDELGLDEALRGQAAALSTPNGVFFDVMTAGELRGLPPGQQVAAYRIATEAMTNVVRHAGARRAVLRLVCDEEGLLLEVEDDGCGPLAPQATGSGLASMRTRAEELGGRFTFTRGANGGALVRARIPASSR